MSLIQKAAPTSASTTSKVPNAGANPISVEEFGLHAASRDNQAAGTTVVSVWGLKTESSEFELPVDVINLPYQVAGRGESIIGAADSRTLVSSKEFGPGGKYRAIVKLFLRFENSPNPGTWAIATGWLIEKDLLVTAGHCAYDWGYKQGKLLEVKAYIGYYGKENVKGPNVQFRKGKRVTTTSGWLKSGSRRDADLSLIKLDAPFENVEPIKYADTPATGLALLGVVGYPGDLRDSKTGEAGANMYESYETTQWSLSANDWRMLEYKIDTYGGNSGSPVFRQRDGVSIGVHTYGGIVNSATVLGEFGNPLDPYIKALSKEPSPESIGEDGEEEVSFQEIPWLYRPQKPYDYWWKNYTHNPILKNPSKVTEARVEDTPDAPNAEESLFKFLKKAFKLVTETGNVTEADLSVPFGELDHIIGPVASIALQSGTGAQHGSSTAIIHRAVLGEAALAAILRMSPETQAEFAILDKMAKVVKDAGPFIKKAWHLFGNVASNPIVRLLADAATKPQAHKESLAGTTFSSELAALVLEDQPTESSSESWETADPGYKSLIEGLVGAATADGQPTDSEAWWTSIAKVVVGGAVGTIGEWVGKKIAGESDINNGEAIPTIPALENAPIRALIGEAALQVLVTVPKTALEKEGSYESMWGIFKAVLPAVIGVGTGVYKQLTKGKKESLKQPIKILPLKPGLYEPEPEPLKIPAKPDPEIPVNGDYHQTRPYKPGQRPIGTNPGPFPPTWDGDLKSGKGVAVQA